MEKIILTSSFFDVADELKKEILLDISNPKQPNVAFFSTAAIVEEIDFYVEKAKNWFKDNGFQISDIDVQNTDQNEIIAILDKSDLIYVSGGNSFFLLQEFKNKGLDNLLMKYIKAGKLYVGESAGSIILSPNIEYVSKMDDASVAKTLKDYQGLSAVDFYTVPHLDNIHFKDAVKKIISEYNEKLKLVPITNNQAIIVKGDKQKTITVK